jgi:MFS superfamily sulfate permease-like transporter
MAKLPVLPTLQGYKISWLTADITAGLTLVAIAVPEQIATAHLANMPAVAGFYAFIAGSLLFALFGRHPRMSVGGDSTIAPVFAAGVAALAATGSPTYTHLVSATALVVGGLMVAAGVLRLGWIADFFPLPVVTGVLAGIGVEILVKQVPTVLGLPGGGTTTIGRLRDVINQLGTFNGWSFGIAAGVLAIVVIGEKIDRKAPGALVAVVGSTVLVGVAKLADHGVHVVGSVHASLPQLALPQASVHQLGALASTAVTVAFLCIVQTSATVRASPTSVEGPGEQAKANDFNVDLLAVGAGSLLAGLSGSFAVNSSPPRTAVLGSAGAKSQVAGLVAVGTVVIVLLFATSLLKDLPEAALGAILIFVASRLFHFGELRSILRFATFEFALAVLTMAIVVLVGIEQGVVAAALLALAQRTRLAARPRDADIGRPTEQLAGILVYLLYAPLWYGNATHVIERLRSDIASEASPVHHLIVDANAVADIDYTGAKAFGEFVAECKQRAISVSLARVPNLVHHDLKHSGLLQTIGPDHLFASVEEAVASVAGPPAAPTGPATG